MRRLVTSVLVAAVIAGLSAFPAGPAGAADRYWDGGTTNIVANGDGASDGNAGTWDTTTLNWDAGTAPHVAWVNANSDTAILGGTAGTVTVAEPVTVGGLQLNTAGYVVTGDALTFASGTLVANASATIESGIAGSPDVDIAAGTLTVAPTSGGAALGNINMQNTTLTLGGTTVGNSVASIPWPFFTPNTTVNKEGSGAWTIQGDAYGGDININDGDLIAEGTLYTTAGLISLNSGATLHFNNPGAIKPKSGPGNEWRINGGAVDNTSGAAITSLTYHPGQRWNDDFTFIGSNGAASDLYLGTGSVVLTGNRTVTVQHPQTTLTVAGTISGGSYGLTKAGAGTLALTGNSTYTGDTTLEAGTLTIGANGALGLGTLTIAQAATVKAQGTVVVTNPVAVSSDFTIGSGGELTLGALTLDDDHTITNDAAGTTLTDVNASDKSLTLTGDGDTTVTGVIALGAGSLIKSGPATLTLSGTSTYAGGTVISGGTVRVTADGNLGDANAPITFDGSATLHNEQGGNTTIDLGARPIALNNGAIATFRLGRGDRFTTTGDVTGDGGVAIQVSGGNSPRISFLGTNNTFTGPVEIRSGSDRPYVTVNSLADSSEPITLNNGGGHFVYGSGAVAALTLNNRPIVVQGGGYIDNLSSFPMTINSSITGSGTGIATLRLSGGQGGTINANIDEATKALSLSVSGAWALSGTNTLSGTTTLNNGATLRVTGAQAMPGGQIQMFRSAKLQFRTDDAGTVNLGNDLVARRHDTSTGIIQNYTIDVANNGGGTTDSTIVFGKMDFTVGDMRPPRQFNTEGDNGYSVQVGDVDLATEIRGTATGGAQRLRGNTAPLEITGTVRQIDGGTGTQPNASNLYLGGTGTGNLVSGTIMDANDFDDLSNPNAVGLNVYKGESGEWTLSGTNTYSGATTVSGGTLIVTGSIDDSDVTVSNTGTRIAGGGSVRGLTINAGAGFVWGFGDGGDHVMDVGDGNMVLNENWVIQLVDLGNDPLAGEQYDLFTYVGTYSGPPEFSDDLANITVDANGAPDWDLTNLTITAGGGLVRITGVGIPGVAGDTNGDNRVDAADYIALKRNLGTGPGATQAMGDVSDGTGSGQDGYVDWSDLDLMANTLNNPAGGATIPEPGSAALLMFGVGWLLKRRKTTA